MRKTTLARTLGATWPRTHAARFPINRWSVNSWDHRFWFGEVARFDQWKPLTPEEILSDIKNLFDKG
jgi:hypothetical protein